MKILITGGAGFIGSHIQDRLIELGHQVAILDNMRSGKAQNINSASKFFNVDIQNFDALQKAIDEFNPQAVFHLAAQNQVPYSMQHPMEDNSINIIGTINLLQIAKEKKFKIIYSNTGGAYYGNVQDNQIPIIEDTPVTHPTSFYGVSKSTAELYIKLYGNLYDISWVSLRYANVYGPRQDGNQEAGIVAIFVGKMLAGQNPTIFGDGSHVRDYVYVSDVVDANVRALDYQQNDYFNIATQMPITNLQVFDSINSQLNNKFTVQFAPPREGDALKVVLNIQKAKQKLGWQPKIDFTMGIKNCIEYYQNIS